nr:hypothetical protein [Bacillus thuringiensis]
MTLVDAGVITSSSFNMTKHSVGKKLERVAGPIICPDLVVIVTTVPIGQLESKKQATPVQDAIFAPPSP